MSADTGIRDVVTGLYVREYFDDVIARELERSRRHEIPLSVVSVVIRDFDGLEAAGVYKEIDEELRSQYLLTYTPPVRKGSAWRKIEVKMTPTNLEARTISGYYP